jgi:hypothetical protein
MQTHRRRYKTMFAWQGTARYILKSFGIGTRSWLSLPAWQR